MEQSGDRVGRTSLGHRLVSSHRALTITALLTLPLAAQSGSVDERGRWAVQLSEGAHRLEIAAPGHTTAWRQVLVPAGATIRPLDVILEPLGPTATATEGSPLELSHGGETAVTLPVALSIPSGTLPPGTTVTLTSVGQQSLAGLLPLGWSPLASAEVRIATTTATAASAARTPFAGNGSRIAGREARAATYERSTGDGRAGDELSRFARLAGVDGFGEGGLRSEFRDADGRALRTHAADSTVGGVDRFEYSRRTREGYDSRLSSASLDRARLVGGARNAVVAFDRSRSTGEDSGRPLFATMRYGQSDAPRLAAFAQGTVVGSSSHTALRFEVPRQALLDSNQILASVIYDSARDEWIVLDTVVLISADGIASVDISSMVAALPGVTAIALVYPDAAPHLTAPPAAISGSPLRGVARPDDVEQALTASVVSMDLSPRQILPTQRATVTVTVDDASRAPRPAIPSGTPVQSFIDEQLRLVDGSTVTEPPFKTDLILYRDLDGSPLTAKFHLATSVRAREHLLRAGYEQISLLPYPFDLVRGNLIGPEGGRVSGDPGIVVELPAGATLEPLVIEARSLTEDEIGALGPINGFRVAGGFELQLATLAGNGNQAPGSSEAVTPAVELWKPARATFSVANATETDQVIIARIVDDSPFGRVFELTSRTDALDSASRDPQSATRLSTTPEDPTSGLPLDGITTEGRYLILIAEAPIAYGWGRVENAGRPLTDAQVLSLAPSPGPRAPLGVSSLTPGSLFALPVLSAPADPFALQPRSPRLGSGAVYSHGVAPEKDAVVYIAHLSLAPERPRVVSVTPADGATDVSLTTNVRVTFSPGIDPSSVRCSDQGSGVGSQDPASCGLVVTNTLTGEAVPGTITADPSGITWTSSLAPRLSTLAPSTRYTVTVAPTVRGTNNAPLGGTFSSSFTTLTQMVATEVNPERIHITIPDGSGRSTVTGLAGALPSGAQAIVVRRDRDFATQYQATAATDGSFTINLGDCLEAVTAGARGEGRGTREGDLASLGAMESASFSLRTASVRNSPSIQPTIGGFDGHEELSRVDVEGARGEGRGTREGDLASLGAMKSASLGAGDQGRGNVYGYSKLSRSECLAAGDGPGRLDLRDDRELLAAGTVRADAAAATRSRLDSVEYCGGSCSKLDGRLSALPLHGARVVGRAGNPAYSGESSELSHFREARRADEQLRGAQSNPAGPAAFARQQTEIVARGASHHPSSLIPRISPLNSMIASEASAPTLAPRPSSLAPCDKVTVTDQLDLYVSNSVGNLIGIVPLTPFSLPDGTGFVAPASTQTTFTTSDGITITVPTGAFDQPTLVTATPETATPFATVPSFNDELTFATAVRLDLDCTIAASASEPPPLAPRPSTLAPPCIARQRLQISIPVPATADTTRQWFLGRLGESTRGPRVMIVDTLRIDGGSFTTEHEPPTTASVVTTSAASIYEGRGARGEGRGEEASLRSALSLNDRSHAGEGEAPAEPQLLIAANVVSAPPLAPRPSPLAPASLGLGARLGENTPDPASVREGEAPAEPHQSSPLAPASAPSLAPRPSSLAPASVASLTASAPTLAPRPSSLAPASTASVKDLLMGVKETARYTVIDLAVQGVGWGSTKLGAENIELHFDQFRSLYVDSVYVDQNDGEVVFPVVTGRPFRVSGVDPSTALTSFEKLYDPITPGGAEIALLDPPDVTGDGPWILHSSPVSVESMRVEATDGIVTSLGGHTLIIDNGLAKIGATAAGVGANELTLVNASVGLRDTDSSNGLTVAVGEGDRVALIRWSRGVESDAPMSLLFSSPVAVGESLEAGAVDAYLHDHLALFRDGEDISSTVRFEIDASRRRVTIRPRANLLAGADHQIVIRPSLAGAVSGLRVGQRLLADGTTALGIAKPLYLPFTVRDAGGSLGGFDIPEGQIRESVMIGNVLLISAMRGGVLAYGTEDPAGMSAASLRGRISFAGEAWGLAKDDHGRIFGTVVNGAFGALRSWDFEVLVETPGEITELTDSRASRVISWSPSADALGVASATLPVAIPRKLFVVTQDADPLIFSPSSLPSGWTATPIGDGWFELAGVEILKGDGEHPYLVQRITVENPSRGARWSADATTDMPAAFSGVVARAGDRLRIVRNLRAWAVVSLFGHGVGVYDLNAMESNRSAVAPPEEWVDPREIVAVATGAGQQVIENIVTDLRFSSDVSAIAASGGVGGFGLNVRDGVLDFAVPLPEQGGSGTVTELERGGGMAIRAEFPAGAAPRWARRLDAVREAYALGLGAPPLVERLSDSDAFGWRVEALDNPRLNDPEAEVGFGARGSIAGSAASREYLLVAAGDLGLLVVEADGANYHTPSLGVGELATGDRLADVVWLPAGVYAVRAVPERDLAVLVDGEGYVHLADLSDVDERWLANGSYREPEDLFPSVRDALLAPYPRPDARIVWSSDVPLANGTLAPLLDPETGILYTSKLQGTETDVSAVLDPSLDILIDLGDGLGTIGAILPLGVPLPQAIAATANGPDASASAFRVAMTLPGDLSPTGTIAVAVESERVPGAPAPQTTAPLPPAHLRSGDGDPLLLRRDIPGGFGLALRHQRMYNRFISDWVVPLADPRASIGWSWPAGTTTAAKAAAGCSNCDRPAHLAGDTSVRELLVSGWTVSLRPELDPASPYAHLADGRLDRRVPSTPTDTTRPTSDLLASQNPPDDGAMLEQGVYLHDGHAAFSTRDFGVAGVGIDFVVTRYYSSGVHRQSGFGWSFDSPLFARVRPLPDGSVDLFDGTGNRHRFTPSSPFFTPPRGVFLDLARHRRGWVVIHPDNSRMFFDSLGRLEMVTDRNYTSELERDGNRMAFHYDDRGRLARVIDSMGRPIEIEYGSPTAHLVGAIRDFTGRTVTYEYDALGRLETVRSPDPQSSTSKQQVTRYRWAPPGAGLPDWLYGVGRIVAEEDGLGRTVWEATYDAARPWAVSSLQTGGGTWDFAASGSEIAVTDPRGAVWRYVHDAAGNIVQIIAPPAGEDPEAVTAREYDSRGRHTRTVFPTGERIEIVFGTSGEGFHRKLGNATEIRRHPRPGTPEAQAGIAQVTTATYGPANLVTSTTMPGGVVVSVERDRRGNPLSATDPTGISTTLTFDERGLIQSIDDPRSGVTTYQYEELEPLERGYLSSVTRSGEVTAIETDAVGNLLHVIDPTGRKAVYEYDALSQILSKTVGSTREEYSWDETGANTSYRVRAGTDEVTGEPIYRAINYAVDELGRVTTVTDGATVTTTVFDPAGDVSQMTATGAGPVSYTYDSRGRIAAMSSAGRTWTYGYDQSGRSTFVTDPRGFTTTFLQDAFGRTSGLSDALGVTRVESTDEGGRPIDVRWVHSTTDGDFILRWMQFTYDSAGRRIEQIAKLFEEPLLIPEDGTDPEGAIDVVTRWIYDDVTHSVTVVDPLGNETLREVDDRGRPVRVTDALGNKIEFEYDEAGRRSAVVTTELGADGSTESFRLRYEYDDESQLIAIHDESARDRVLTTRLERDDRGLVVAEIDPAGNRVTFEYDVKGRLVSETSPTGAETSYGWDDADRLVSLTDPGRNTTTWTYSPEGDLISETRDDGSAWSYTWGDNGRIETLTDPDGSVTTYTYDAENRLVGLQTARAQGVEGPATITYERDPLGRVVGGLTDEGVETGFRLDSLDRVIEETVRIGAEPQRSTRRVYDPAGNVTELRYPSGLVLSMSYDPLHRLNEVREGAGLVARYGDHGSRMISRILGNGIDEAWSWDENRRLVGIESLLGAERLRDLDYERNRAGWKEAIRQPERGLLSRLTPDAAGRITAEDLWMEYDPLGIEEPGAPELIVTREWSEATNLLERARTDQRGRSGAVSTTSAFRYDDRNRTTSADGQLLGWSANGNVTSIPAAPLVGRLSSLTLGYDSANRLTSASASDGTEVEILYDGFGRKVRQSVTAAGVTRTTDYALDGARVIEEHENGALARRYVGGRAIDEIVRLEHAPVLGEPLSEEYYPLQNELGTVELVTDASGAVRQRIEYEGFGLFRAYRPNPAAASPDAEDAWLSDAKPLTNRLFQGREWVPALAAYDFRARALWPELGRFGQEDPSGFADHANLYQSLLANPYDVTDPSGNVVVLMHGIKDDGGNWARLVGEALGEEWDSLRADAGQDVINLVNRRGGNLAYELSGHYTLGLSTLLCPADEFCLSNAARVGGRLGKLDKPTQRAGEQAANYFHILRGKLDASDTRQGEPVQVLAHSHGTSILLAAAEARGGQLGLGNVILAGSDINRFRDISKLMSASQMLYNFWSPGDHITRHVVQGGGGWGFQARSRRAGKLNYRLQIPTLRADVPGKFEQRQFREIEHTGAVQETRRGMIPWMSQVLAREQYAGIFKLTTPRRASEPDSWIREYERIRNAMGLHEVVGLREEFFTLHPDEE